MNIKYSGKIVIKILFILKTVAALILIISIAALAGCESSKEIIKTDIESEDIVIGQDEEDPKQDSNLSFEKSIAKFALKFDKSMIIASSDSSVATVSMRENLIQVSQANYENLENYIIGFENNKENNFIYASCFDNLANNGIIIAQAEGKPPESFFQPLDENGYIDVPKGGGCPLGALTYIRFLTEEEEIILELLKTLEAKALPYDILSLPPQSQKSIVSFISEKLTPENKELIKVSYWNKEIWGTEGDGGLKSLQVELEALLIIISGLKLPR